ncbi:MAG TPA: hypothetical protein VKD69_00060 [Vicinamibacterales bacterium]|nr:hypothetical protein [Vicinamibacterales bacterium]
MLIGAALALAAALWARAHVVRPIRLFGALAIAGVVAAPAALLFCIPRAFLAMTTCVALAFSVNRRPLSQAVSAATRRALWIAAAALMLAFASLNVDRAIGSGGIGAVSADLGMPLIVLLATLGAFAYIVRGIVADPGDRLLIGVLAALVSSPIVTAYDLLRYPWLTPAAFWTYPYCVLLGAALARANGNVRRP